MYMVLAASDPDISKRWSKLLSDSIPYSSVKTINTFQDLDTDSIVKCEIMICICSNDQFIKSIVDRCSSANIPLLCIIDNKLGVTEKNMIGHGIKGLLNSNLASLDSIKNAINIVRNGGLYIEPSLLESPQPISSSKERPVLNMEEWNVFSLTSKGLTIGDISDQLGISEDKIRTYQKQIIDKTKSKTLPGAVANGIRQGWLHILN